MPLHHSTCSDSILGDLPENHYCVRTNLQRKLSPGSKVILISPFVWVALLSSRTTKRSRKSYFPGSACTRAENFVHSVSTSLMTPTGFPGKQPEA